jgi:hypothetical protein
MACVAAQCPGTCTRAVIVLRTVTDPAPCLPTGRTGTGKADPGPEAEAEADYGPATGRWPTADILRLTDNFALDRHKLAPIIVGPGRNEPRKALAAVGTILARVTVPR